MKENGETPMGTIRKEVAQAVMSGFFAGIQSREALPKREAQSA